MRMIKRLIDKVSSEPKSGFYFLFWSTLVILIIIIPWNLNNLMMELNIETANGLSNRDWLGFWGGYLGSAFGVIASLFAFLFTYIQNEKQHKQTREEMKEQSRLAILPMIDVKLSATDFPENDISKNMLRIDTDLELARGRGDIRRTPHYEEVKKAFNSEPSSHFIKLEMTNIGLAALTDLFIGASPDKMFPLGSLAKGSSISYDFLFPLGKNSYSFLLYFRDMQNNLYKQSFLYCTDGHTAQYSPTGYPELVNEDLELSSLAEETHHPSIVM